ncbi:MAG: sensor histidine kinase, partial [Granulosicoccaceae bacterium]
VLLRALTMFRLLSCLFFLCAPFLPFTQQFTAPANLVALLAISALYSIASISMGVLYWRRQPDLSTQVGIQIYVDIIFVTLLMNQLGGVASGVGILLCASLSATALLRQAHASYFFAAVATLAVLGQSLYVHLSDYSHPPEYPQAAALCIALFVVSVLSSHYNKHRSASTALIVDQQKQLAGLQSLSNEMLRQFDHGLLAITRDGKVAHSNPTAMRLLGYQERHADLPLEALAPSLVEFLNTEQSSASVSHRGGDLYVTSKRIKGDIRLLTLVTQSQRDAEAHQLKLATLGQWTASVAHEIRNPLSAITQASQLLNENTESQSLPHRLAEIIQRNSERIDLIVTDILNLARPSRNLEPVYLKAWLQQLAAEIRVIHQLPEKQISVAGNPALVEAIDKEKLRHVIENLCKNSLTHGGNKDIHIHLEVESTQGNTVIRLHDNGKGIPQDLQDRLFDPFYANASGGTGLGLFIAREICEQHQIKLKLCSTDSGATFELTFHRAIQPDFQQAA